MDNEVSHIFRAVVVRGRILSLALTCGLLDPTLSSKGWGMRRPFVQTVRFPGSRIYVHPQDMLSFDEMRSAETNARSDG